MIWALVAVLLAVPIGVFLVRPRIKGLFHGDFQGIKTEAILGPIITLTVFLSAFVVAQATQTYQRANSNATAEATAVRLLFENAGLLPDGQGNRLQATSVCYARAVVNKGWPAMTKLEAAPEVDFWSEQFNQEIPKVLDGPGAVVSQIVSLSRAQSEARTLRLNEAEPHLPILTIVLMIGSTFGVVLLASSLAVPDMRRRVLLGLTFTLAVLLGGTLYLVEQLEEPFTGLIRVQPTVMERNLSEMAGVFRSPSALKCDENGVPA